MGAQLEEKGEIRSWKEVQLLYTSALKQIATRIEILNDEFQHVHLYNPIEHVSKRIKTSESIVKKLKSHGYEPTIENMVRYVNDIAGIRVICSFTSDIYRIAEMISKQSDIKVVAVKDYILHPKSSGYRSYHMIVTIPVYLSDRINETKVEMQIRTVAMDFWASLEHKIQYKFEGDAPSHINTELMECARMVAELDARMLQLNDEIEAIRTEGTGSDAVPGIPGGMNGGSGSMGGMGGMNGGSGSMSGMGGMNGLGGASMNGGGTWQATGIGR